MEIPTWLFFSFWALTSTTFLHLSFHALDKTQLHISPLLMLFLKHSLAISSSSSSAYALKYRPHLIHQFPTPYFLIFYTILSTFLNKTTDAIILRATLITFYSHLQSFLLHLHSFLIPFLAVSAIFSLRCLCDFLFFFLGFLWFSFLVSLRFPWPFLRATLIAIYSHLQSFLLHFHSLPIPFVIFKHFKKILLGIRITWLLFPLRGEILSITYSSILFLLLVIVKLVSAIFSLRWLCDLPFFFPGFLWFSFLGSLRFSWRLLNFSFHAALTLGTGDYEATDETIGRVAVLMVSEISLFFVSVERTDFYPIAAVLLSHLIAATLAAASRFLEEEDGAWSEYLAKVKESKVKKVLEFGVGVGGAIVFKKMLFEFTSWDEAAAFLYLGVMWLANLTLLGFPFDFGIFFFVVGSVVVGWCSWIVCAVALLLFCLRLKLESLDFVYEEDDHIQVGVF